MVNTVCSSLIGLEKGPKQKYGFPKQTYGSDQPFRCLDRDRDIDCFFLLEIGMGMFSQMSNCTREAFGTDLMLALLPARLISAGYEFISSRGSPQRGRPYITYNHF